MPAINTEELKAGIYEKLRASGWASHLKSFVLSQEMDDILNQLHREAENGRRFTPRLRQMFRFLECCPYDKLKVVVVGQDAYQHVTDGANVADGIAFSVSNTLKLQPSLKFIHQEIQDSIYPGKVWKGPLDLKVWAEQGVLLMNIALTTSIGKSGTHYGIWKNFVCFLLDHLSWQRTGLVYCYLGSKAKDYSRLTNDACYKIYATHPASAAYNNQEKWNSGDPSVFVKINQLLVKDGKSPIVW